MSNYLSLKGFLMVELSVTLLFISFIILIIAHYQFLVIRWQQEVYDRLAMVNYSCNFFIDPAGTFHEIQGEKKNITLRYRSINCARPVNGLSDLKEPHTFSLFELIMSWKGPWNTEYSYTIIGSQCT